MSSTSAIGRTSLVGGDGATLFNDLDKLTASNGQVNLDEQSSIKQIIVYSGWTVDGITVTYRGADGSTTKVVHGLTSQGNDHTIDLSDSEYISSATGRAGYQQYYDTTGINSIGFTIVDRKTNATRTVGPFGNDNWSNNGNTFSTGPVVAFSGYARTDVPQMGVRGIYFIGFPGGSVSFTPEPLRSARVWRNAGSTALQPISVLGLTPRIIYGFSYLDVGGSSNIAAVATIKETARDSFVPAIEAQTGSSLAEGAIDWLDVPLGRGIQSGLIPYQETPLNATTNPFVLGNITFNKPYSQPPAVLLWLTGLNINKSRNYRLKTYATNVTQTGFTANVAVWADTQLYGSSVAWLAVPADSQDVVVGTFSATQSSQSGQASFGRTLAGKPRIIPAINALDFASGRNLRFDISAENVTTDGFTWKVRTWSDSYMYWGAASYIAIVDPSSA